MAGIVAAATGNGLGVAGVGFAGVDVMPVRVLDADGTGQDSDIIEGVVYAADHGADVILMAFSNPGFSASLGYFDTYRRERLPANLIQAQRDFFGSHTYLRIDDPTNTPIHTEWRE